MGAAGGERKRAGNDWQESGLVFTTSVSTPFDARNLTCESKRHLVTAELPKELRFYDMRHTA
jgi:integrase